MLMCKKLIQYIINNFVQKLPTSVVLICPQAVCVTVSSVLCRADVYWKNVVSDLAAYAKHANRGTIFEADVELLLKRSALHHHKANIMKSI